MPKPFPYLFRFFGSLAGLFTLVALLEFAFPNFWMRLNYGFVLAAFYLLFFLTAAHLLALVFYFVKYLFYRP